MVQGCLESTVCVSNQESHFGGVGGEGGGVNDGLIPSPPYSYAGASHAPAPPPPSGQAGEKNDDDDKSQRFLGIASRVSGSVGPSID